MGLKVTFQIIYVQAKFFCTSDSISKLDPWGNHTRDCDAPPEVTGPCLAAMPRWTFKNGVCVKFMYGGCKGSKNRFHSLEECKRVCKSNDANPGPNFCPKKKPEFNVSIVSCETSLDQNISIRVSVPG